VRTHGLPGAMVVRPRVGYMADERLDYLERLGEALTERGYLVRTISPSSGPPYLRVANPTAPVLTDRVLCERGTDGVWRFWWPWAQRIGPIDALDASAEHVARVLAAIDR